MRSLRSLQTRVCHQNTTRRTRRICCIVKGSQGIGNWTDQSCCCKRQCIVWAESMLQNCPFPDEWALIWLYGFVGLTLQYVCPLGHWSWEGIEILHPIQYEPQKPIVSIFAWRWMDVDQCNGQYHKMKIYTLDWQQLFNSYSRHNMTIWANSDLTKVFLNEKYIIQLSF